VFSNFSFKTIPAALGTSRLDSSLVNYNNNNLFR